MDGQQRRLVPERIGVGLSLVLFGVPALLLWLATTQLLPILVARGCEPLVAWFLSGALVLAPLLAAALLGAWIALPEPSLPTMLKHLRVRRLSAEEWRLAGLVLMLTIAAMAGLQLFNASVWPGLPPHPPFMAVKPLEASQSYILALWLPFFALNIVGEELWWRGFIQPRQEPVFGRTTWLVQGLLHGLFHFSFGFGGHVRPVASCVQHTLGCTAHAEHVGRHRHPCRGQWAGISGCHSGAAAGMMQPEPIVLEFAA